MKMKCFAHFYNPPFLFSSLSSDREQEIAEITPTRVTQGQTWDKNEECCAAAHAIDRDLSTLAATETGDGTGWIKLEFDEIYFIHKVVIYFRFYTNWFYHDDKCMKSETNFQQCLDSRSNVDVSVYQREVHQKSCGTLQLNSGLEQSDQIYNLLCMTEGDMVKLSKDEGYIVVYDVAVSSTGRVNFLFFMIYLMLSFFCLFYSAVQTDQCRYDRYSF